MLMFLNTTQSNLEEESLFGVTTSEQTPSIKAGKTWQEECEAGLLILKQKVIAHPHITSRERTGSQAGLSSPKAPYPVTLLLVRLHILQVAQSPQAVHQLGTKYSNTRCHGGAFLTPTSTFMGPLGLWPSHRCKIHVFQVCIAFNVFKTVL